MKPWTEVQFRTHRPHLSMFVKTQVRPLIENPACNRIIIHAPVKSGKREMMEYIAVYDTGTKREHVSISAWYRKADNIQREEIEQHNLKVFVIHSVRSAQECLDWLHEKLHVEQQELIIHLDECDYGSGNSQAMNDIWKMVRHNEFSTCILYSATPEEVMCSSELSGGDAIDDMLSGVSVVYTPPDGYCGPERFLQEGLIHEAEEFFTYEHAYELSDQGKHLIDGVKKHMKSEPRRNIIVLRLTYSELGGELDKKSNKAFYKFTRNIREFSDLDEVDVIVDKEALPGNFLSERVDWSNKEYWDSKGTDRPLLIVIDQTSSRSTEWSCHDRIYATHDYRHHIRYNTVSQAQERVNHYSQKYGGFQPIQVYGSVDVFRLSAKQIDYVGFYNPIKWKLGFVGTNYIIKSTHGTALHPDCPPEGLIFEQAKHLIRMLFKKRSLSSRIHGKAKIVPTYHAVWKKFNPDNWDTEWPLFRDNPANGLHSEEWAHTHNPFTTASLHRLPNGEWRGNYRGWRKLFWKEGKLFTKLQGVFQQIHIASMDNKPIKKICYHEGEVGVVFFFVRGSEQLQTLHPTNSMYGIAI